MNSHDAYLRKIGLSFKQINAWNNLQLNLFNQGEAFCESSKYCPLQTWQIYAPEYDDLYIQEQNEHLKLLFSNKKTFNFKESLKLEKNMGFIFPVKELMQHSYDEWRNTLNTQAQRKHFPFHIFFEKTTKSDINDATEILWNYLTTYQDWLIVDSINSSWYSKLDVNINSCSGFCQLFLLLLQYAERNSNSQNSQYFWRNISCSHKKVQGFFKQFKSNFETNILIRNHESILKTELFKLARDLEQVSIKKESKENEQTSFLQRVLQFSIENLASQEIAPLAQNPKNPQTNIETLDFIFNPYFTWSKKSDYFIPEWNIYIEMQKHRSYNLLENKLQYYEAEKKRLSELIYEINKLYSIKEFDKFVNKTADFEYQENQEKWNHQLEIIRRNIELRIKYRKHRMEEFGILTKSDNKYTRKKEIWLDEMLKIEEEIGAYIPFVKQAFKSALPMQKRIVFDAIRTIQDGVEFEPLSVFNHEQWLRGNVMKAMREEKTFGEVEQINCFCLDFSGSMHHERMRNLFKVLYLLVLGLEDKKSYDAFHFFSNKFIEGINFSADYTNRKVLFQILKIISKQSFGLVMYEGLDGTNFSKGIDGCRDKIKEFRRSLLGEQLNKNVLCSMFVITDGRPSLGIINLEKLNNHIQLIKEIDDISIKGIYLQDNKNSEDFMEQIFGYGNFVRSKSFEEASDQFVKIMTETYKKQREDFRWQQKRERISGK